MAITKWRALEAQEDAVSLLDDRKEERIDREIKFGKLEKFLGTDWQISDDIRKSKKFRKLKSKFGSSLTDPLQSPQGQIVGRMLADSRELMKGVEDPESERWKSLSEDLTEPAYESLDLGLENAERALASESRAVESDFQDLSSMRGAGRNPMADREDLLRHRERVGTSRASLYTTVGQAKAEIGASTAQWMHSFVRNYAANTVAFARNWAAGAPFIREQFQQSLDNLAVAQSQANTIAAGHLLNYETNQKAIKQAGETDWVGAIAGILGAGVGAKAGASPSSPGDTSTTTAPTGGGGGGDTGVGGAITGAVA